MRATENSNLRELMSHFATGVTIVAATDPHTGVCRGLTANAVCSVSLDPPLILVCVARKAATHDVIARAGIFTVNVLADAQQQESALFASPSCADKFAHIQHDISDSGAPLLSGSLAWIECRVWAAYPGGDHTIFVGRVIAGECSDDSERPLVFYRGGYQPLKMNALVSAQAG
jgi:flavin reductase (DIM6/NTAB) family NADH-FMN oxidoreductase RutF